MALLDEYSESDLSDYSIIASLFTMAEHVLISLDFEQVQSLTWKGLDWNTLSILGRVKIDASPKNYDEAVSFVSKYFNHVRIYCDVVALDSIEDIISLLNYGVAKVFVSHSQIQEIVDQGILEDTDRLIVNLDGSQSRHSAAAAAAHAVQQSFQAGTGKLIRSFKVQDVDSSDSWDSKELIAKPSSGFPTCYVTLANNTLAEYLWATHAGFISIVSASSLTVEPDKYPDLLPVHQLITANMRSDRPDGLFPTVVTDEHGICLGLVYSNEQSIEASLRLRRGAYYSRSRNGLWIKGEESGDIQHLVSIEWDCDADALRFMVRQEGDGESTLKLALKRRS